MTSPFARVEKMNGGEWNCLYVGGILVEISTANLDAHAREVNSAFEKESDARVKSAVEEAKKCGQCGGKDSVCAGGMKDQIREAESRVWEEAAKIAEQNACDGNGGCTDERCPDRRKIAAAIRARSKAASS